ncbi:hypothetical protein CISG_04517 [Coccidioides immitis RMSCC 3703]|uniref:Uncharacterized protein n=1 Tax=Coccidioides immitis RMSCC 3703 TaxID=454286 RepID=A0A0J8QPS9_COCIT|nr:hypothetical protein CISG_04517 [Coccidioides immitis RMSCC 3703]
MRVVMRVIGVESPMVDNRPIMVTRPWLPHLDLSKIDRKQSYLAGWALMGRRKACWVAYQTTRRETNINHPITVTRPRLWILGLWLFDKKALALANRDHKALALINRDHKALTQAGRDHKALALANRDHKALTQAGRDHKALTQAGRDHKALTQAGRDQKALTQAGRDHKALAQAGRDHKALALAGRDQKALTQAGRDHKAGLWPEGIKRL